MTFHRPKLALDMAEQLLRPKGLQVSVRSGLFLGGLRRIGKTTFLRSDLVPALENLGAIVVYVDLWSNTHAKPTDLLLAEVRKKLAELQSLYDQKLISASEYAAAKTKVLNQMTQ